VFGAGQCPGAGYDTKCIFESAIIGLLATPLAPVAKDLSTAIQAASKAVGVLRG
jgi:hypothetical protein